MDDNNPFSPSNFENNPIGSFPKFEKAGQVSLERKEFGGIEVYGEPFESI